MARNKRYERGYALLVTGMCAAAICGALGLAVDLGRLYIVRNEMQTFTDSAALAAAAQLDGTSGGVNRARQAVNGNPNLWNLGTTAFSGVQVEYASTASGPWQTSPSPAGSYGYVKVTATNTAPLYFLPAVTSQNSLTLRTSTIAGQVPISRFTEGLTPFSPLAHGSTPDMGFVAGQQYTLRWPASPKLNVNVCSGDNAQQWVDLAQAGGGSERGYIEATSSDMIRQAIIGNYQTQPLAIGDTVTMTGGNKQTELNALLTRVEQDSNATAASYNSYVASGSGNGRRLIVVPANSGYPSYQVAGFALFFLLSPGQYDSGGNKPWCAEYVGPYVEGARNQAAGMAGAYTVRLVQ